MVGSPQPQYAQTSQPTLYCAASATTLLSTFASLVAPNSVSSSASPVWLLCVSALLNTSVLNDGQSSPYSAAMLANGQ